MMRHNVQFTTILMGNIKNRYKHIPLTMLLVIVSVSIITVFASTAQSSYLEESMRADVIKYYQWGEVPYNLFLKDIDNDTYYEVVTMVYETEHTYTLQLLDVDAGLTYSYNLDNLFNESSNYMISYIVDNTKIYFLALTSQYDFLRNTTYIIPYFAVLGFKPSGGFVLILYKKYDPLVFHGVFLAMAQNPYRGVLAGDYLVFYLYPYDFIINKHNYDMVYVRNRTKDRVDVYCSYRLSPMYYRINNTYIIINDLNVIVINSSGSNSFDLLTLLSRKKMFNEYTHVSIDVIDFDALLINASNLIDVIAAKITLYNDNFNHTFSAVLIYKINLDSGQTTLYELDVNGEYVELLSNDTLIIIAGNDILIIDLDKYTVYKRFHLGYNRIIPCRINSGNLTIVFLLSSSKIIILTADVENKTFNIYSFYTGNIVDSSNIYPQEAYCIDYDGNIVLYSVLVEAKHSGQYMAIRGYLVEYTINKLMILTLKEYSFTPILVLLALLLIILLSIYRLHKK